MMCDMSEGGVEHISVSEKKRNTIGYITPYIWGDLSMNILKGAIRKAQELDVNLICYIGDKFNDRIVFNNNANIAYQLIDCNMLDGVVIWGSQIFDSTSREEAYKFFDRYKSVPIVSIGLFHEGCNNIYLDDYAAIRQVVSHLVECHGCRNIGFAKGPERHANAGLRFEGYKKALEEFGLSYRPELVADPGEFNANTGIRAVKQLLEDRKLQPKTDLDAIITPSDFIAIGISAQLEQMGIRVPEDIALAGFNNRVESRVCKPALTTVDPLFTIHGQEAIEMIVKLASGRPDVPSKVEMPGKLILRQSCGCLEPVAYLNDFNPGKSAISSDFDFGVLIGNIGSIVQKIKAGVESQSFDLPDDRLVSLIEKFIADLKGETTTAFVQVLGSVLHTSRHIPEYITLFQNIISGMRGAMLPLLNVSEIMLKATDLWNQARIQIHQAAEYEISQQAVRYDEQLFMVHFTDHSFMTTFDMTEMMSALERILLRIGIPGCYISIYEDQENPLQAARLIFAYHNNKRINIEHNDYIFNPQELIPAQVRPNEERHTLMVHTLFFRDKQLGVVVFEPGPMDKAVYSILSGQLSSALYRTIIFNELKMAEEERKNLLETLELKNYELERRIEERTADIQNVNEKLRIALEDANSANTAKSRFLANMSHEIRTPINCIIGFAEIISNSEDISQHRRYISLIIEETRKLIILINQILDISKIEAGKLELHKESFNLIHFMESITSTYAAACQSKGLEYEFNILDAVPEMIHGDQVRLRQILVNLIGNAIKFTYAGTVKVSIEKVLETGRDITLLFKISDTGIGIPQHRQSSIFDTFVQAEDSTTRKFGGTGLGTAISKQLVKLMGGEIGVKSKEGRGSTFWFTAVFGKLESIADREAVSQKSLVREMEIPYGVMAKSTVMLVEDYPVNRELALVHLSNLGCNVVVAENGVQAVEKFMQHEIDLILMDVQMPMLDGCEATRIIRRQESGKTIPIIGLTANAFESDVIHYYEVGMNDVLTKPFSRDEFRNKVIFWLKKSEAHKIAKQDIADHEYNQSDIEAVPAIDIERNLKELDGDREFFLSITLEFIRNVKEQIPLLLAAAAGNDYESVMREAHKIKGGALNLAAKPLAELARHLENKGKEKDLVDAPNVIQELREAIAGMEAYLEKNFVEER